MTRWWSLFNLYHSLKLIRPLQETASIWSEMRSCFEEALLRHAIYIYLSLLTQARQLGCR